MRCFDVVHHNDGGMRVSFALTSLVALVFILGSGCGSTAPAPSPEDGALTAVTAYVDTEVEIAADAGACRDDLARGRAIVPGDTAICIAGFAQTLLEQADAVTSAAAPVSNATATCATSRAALRLAARRTSDSWRHVVDLVRRAAAAEVGPTSASITTAVAAADARANALIVDQLGAFSAACLSGTAARRAEAVPERHRAATHRAGQTI
jgi:hypothetical protein